MIDAVPGLEPGARSPFAAPVVGVAAVGGHALEVPLYARVNARYIVQACSAGDCVDSDPVAVSGTLVEAIGYFKASNTEAGVGPLGLGDRFGFAVALSADGSTLAVGAEREDGDGIDGDQGNNGAADAGAVYVFVRGEEGWRQQEYIKASNAGEDDRFGAVVALSADGNTLAVGAAGADSVVAKSGAVYVFVREDGDWCEQQIVRADNAGNGDQFGHAVALSPDGDILAVGAPGEDSPATGIDPENQGDLRESVGAVYVFARNGVGAWSQQSYIKERFIAPNNGRFGNAVALGATTDNNLVTLAVGFPLLNVVRIVFRSGGVWHYGDLDSIKVEGSGSFGGTAAGAVALSADGSTLAVGAPSTDRDGGAVNVGAVYVFVRENGVWGWSEPVAIEASNAGENDFFGAAVALSADGKTLAVGARYEDSSATGIGGDQSDSLDGGGGGAVYMFARQDGGAWSQQAYVKASNTGGDPRGRVLR